MKKYDESIAERLGRVDTPLPGVGWQELRWLVGGPIGAMTLWGVGQSIMAPSNEAGLTVIRQCMAWGFQSAGIGFGVWAAYGLGLHRAILQAVAAVLATLYHALYDWTHPPPPEPEPRVIFSPQAEPDSWLVPGTNVDRRDLKAFIQQSLRAGAWTQDTLEGTLMPSGYTMEPNLWGSITAILAGAGVLSIGGPGNPTRLIVPENEIPERLLDGGISL